ncbi:cyclic nucleotide-binding domain-containing protein [Sphingomonas aurantiaca]|uniref:cyclic nucleotide-binding domain-containing protein n=1 Tax=Sphingomonas aurantiaca TaxID=185949 RepID=UPI003A5C3B53
MGPGTWFGELSTLDAGPRPHDAIAFGAARVLHIGIEAFRRLAAATPECGGTSRCWRARTSVRRWRS